ncbi:MAG: glycosyltransferase [Chlamydiales bacterium]
MSSYIKRFIQPIVYLTCLCLLTWGGYAIYSYYLFQPYITVVGSVCMADGIGRQSVELLSELQKKVTVDFIPTTKTYLKDIPRDLKKILRNRHKKLGRIILFEDCIWVPGRSHYQILKDINRKEHICLAYSMFESTEIPKTWVNGLNHYFDAVIVPDPFHIEVYKQNGVTIPIFVLPLGLNLSDFLQKPLKSQCGVPFTFATLGAGVSRKNILKSIDAFSKVFKNHRDVNFRIHCRYALPEIEREIKKYISANSLHNVLYTCKRLSRDEYMQLFQSIDCYVNLSKGEGFSIQPREAMALGIPVIITDNTAQTTICSSGLVKSVPATITLPAERRWGGILQSPEIYGEEFDCRVEDASQAFLDMYTNYCEFVSNNHLAREWAKQYDYSLLRPMYLCLIQPERVILSNRNEIHNDCIITDNISLYLKYNTLIQIYN